MGGMGAGGPSGPGGPSGAPSPGVKWEAGHMCDLPPFHLRSSALLPVPLLRYFNYPLCRLPAFSCFPVSQILRKGRADPCLCACLSSGWTFTS